MAFPQCSRHIKLPFHFLLLFLLGICLCLFNTTISSLLCCGLLLFTRAFSLSADDIVITGLINAVQGSYCKQYKQIYGVKVVTILIFHQQVHGNSSQKYRDRNVIPAAGAANEHNNAQCRECHNNHIVVIIDIAHAIQKRLSLRCQSALLIHKKQIPGRTIVIIGPEHRILMKKQIQNTFDRGFEPLQGKITAGSLRLLCAAGFFQRLIQIIRILLVPSAISLLIETDKQVITERGASPGDLAVHGIGNTAAGDGGSKHKCRQDQNCTNPSMAHSAGCNRQIIAGQDGQLYLTGKQIQKYGNKQQHSHRANGRCKSDTNAQCNVSKEQTGLCPAVADIHPYQTQEKPQTEIQHQ